MTPPTLPPRFRFLSALEGSTEGGSVSIPIPALPLLETR